MAPSDELKKVLYVEDDSSIQLVTRLALEEIGRLEVKVCSNGQEALDVAEEFSPDLLLLDVMMPVLDGPSTLLAMRKLECTKDTPAIFMTAKVQPQEVEELNRLPGTIGIIAKPFDPMTLAEQLQETWNQRQH